MGVSIKDKELKLEDIEVPHTLGGASYIRFRYIDLAEGGKSLAEVELRKPRNLFECVSEEREDGERGDGEGADSQATLCACMSEERGHGEICHTNEGPHTPGNACITVRSLGPS
jgi:hypothetical protein